MKLASCILHMPGKGRGLAAGGETTLNTAALQFVHIIKFHAFNLQQTGGGGGGAGPGGGAERERLREWGR